MLIKRKNVKISDKHHEILKIYAEKNGMKIYKIIEKWIDQNCHNKKDTLYDE